ncbi:hypothetical protein AB1K84_21485 [Mesobacillus foraminis]|uniref:Uncharacterized protein n=1 Tax=Mesobacillus foraminis TaxID=279826 RepID=A0A4R2B2Y5_9BACI|nr:hypothetical protein [Mesobacillus foraminis]TCN20415.1 hypothetical protein EV146_11432 [Mesobacillus foraminis]
MGSKKHNNKDKIMKHLLKDAKEFVDAKPELIKYPGLKKSNTKNKDV